TTNPGKGARKCVLNQQQAYRLDGASIGRIESGSEVLVEPARVDCLVKWQEASGVIAATEPRKLFAPVRSRSKHTSNGSPLISAHMASPLTRSVPAGCVAYCGNPLPPKRITPPTEPSAVDTALSGRPFKASKREEVSDNKAARFIGAHVSRDCRRRHRKTRD